MNQTDATPHSITVRVRYNECDPQRVAHHAAYLPWMEIARTELLRTSGIDYRKLEAQGVFFVVAKAEVNYKSPARYDDTLEVAVQVTGQGRARIDHAYEIWRLEDAKGRVALIAQAVTVIVCVGEDGRPQVLPEWLRGPTSPRARTHSPASPADN